MIALENILSQEIIQKLGWTLLHFIWQAATVALILAILLRLLRKSTANLRYIIASLALALIILLPLITIQLVPVSAPHMEARIVPVPARAVLPTVEMPASETIILEEPLQSESVTLMPAVSWKQRAVELLEPALPYIVSGWLVGVFGLSVWHLGGWAQLQRLKRRMVKQVDDTLHSKLKVLAQKLRVKQTVQLMESALVQIPTVVGWLRPVILIPASALTGLSAEQLEAILAHELAHIRRCDYLINILQTIVEILGFYHPAVWWVSHKIRAERENCCDDLAVSISGDRVCYAKALTSMEEIRTGHGQLAVAADSGNLFKRIYRLLGKDSEEKTGFSWIPAATAILLILALVIPTALALTAKSNPQQSAPKTDSDKPSLTICTGRIINSKGNPLASAKVAAYEEYFDMAGNVKLRLVGESVTKADGNFIFQTRPSVEKNRSKGGLIVSQKEGLAIGWAHWPLYGDQRAMITLQEPTKLSGKVVDENGESIPNADVRAVLFENKTTQEGKVSWLPGIQPFNGLSVRTDKNGRFEFNNIPENIASDLLVTASGFSTIYTRRPDLMGYEGAEFVAGQTDIKVTMPIEARIEGKVVNKRTGAGLPGIILKVIPHFTPVFFERYLCTTKEDGTFNIGGLRSGKYMIRRVVARTPTVDVVVESGKTIRNVILKIPYEVRNKIDKENVRSGKILLKLINPSSQPVVGAWVGTFVDWSDIAESPPVWFLNDGGSYKASKIESAAKIISNEEGEITLTEEELFKPQWPTERTVPLTAIDEGHYLAGLRELSREDLGTEVTLTLQPGCWVHGRVSAATARKRKWSTNILTVYVYWHEHRPCQYTSKQGRFEFVLPPGKYKVMVYSEDPDKAVILPILIKPGQRDLDLTEYLDGKRKLSSQTTDMQVEDDRLGESQQGKDSLANNIPTVLPTIVKSPIPSAQDKTTIQVDCLIVEVSLDSKMDRETTIVAENTLGNKISLRDTKVNVLLRKAVEATVATKDKSAENKRVTQEQFKAFVDMLISKGYLRILMNPRIEVVDGKTAKISSTQKISSMQGSIEDLIQITPHVFADGYITLQVEATISSKSKPKGIEQIPTITTREVSTLVRTSPGESRIIGELKERGKSTKTNSNVKDSEKQATEVLFILTPTIVTSTTDSQEKTDVPVKVKSTLSAYKLKQLGLAVIMYADDHDKKLPDTLEALKPYIDSEKNYFWLLNNVEYFGKNKNYRPNQPHIPVAYDKTQIDEQSGTDVLFLDGHVEFITPQKLNEFDIIKAATVVTRPDESAEPNEPMETVNLNNVEMKTIVEKLAEWTGKVIIPTAELMKQKITIYAPEKLPRSKAVAVIYSALRLKGYTAEETVEAIILKPVKEAKPAQVPAISHDDSLEMVENKDRIVQKFYKLEYYSPLQMAQIVKPLLSHTGYISADEKTGNLLIIDTVKNLLRIENIIAQFDVPEAGQTITEIFEIRYGDPAEIVKSLRMLISGRPGFGAIIEPSKQPIVLIPETRRKWIIAKASAEDMKMIGEWIAKLDHEEPVNKDYEVVAITYTDVTKLADRLNESIKQIPGLESQADILLQPLEQAGQIIIFGSPDKRQMVKKLIAEIDIPPGKFETKVFKLKYSNPNQIKENIDNLYGGTAPTGPARYYYYRYRRGSQPGDADIVKVISYPELKQVTVIASTENMLKIAEQIKEWDVPLDVDKLKPRIIELQNSDAAQMAELLRMLFSEEGGGGLNIQNILIDRGTEIKQKIVGPPHEHLTFEEVPGTNKLIVISKIPEAYDVIEEFISDLDRREMTPEDMKQIGEWIKKLDRKEPIPASLLKAEKLKGLIETGKRVESAKKLSNLGKALLIYANDHEDKYPLSLRRLRDYLDLEEFNWALANIEYLARGKTIAVRPDTVIAYDKTLLTKGKGTNVLFNDSHVEFVKPERLKELGISATEILIETRILSVSEDFLQSIGLDANSVSSSDAWSEHLVAKYAAEPNAETYSLILDDLHISFLLKAAQAHKGAKVLAAPQVLTHEGKTASIGIMTESYYVLGYTEPNDPSDKPEPKTDKVEIGTRIWLKPELTRDNEKIKLDFKMEFSQLLGYEERKYKGKYIYIVPRTEIVSTEMPCLIPDGKTLLIVGQKITDKVSTAPILSRIPVVGEMFRSRDKTKDQRMLLILVKPIINPQQKAGKILPGQEDSEEHIKSLANQLEKKLNPIK